MSKNHTLPPPKKGNVIAVDPKKFFNVSFASIREIGETGVDAVAKHKTTKRGSRCAREI